MLPTRPRRHPSSLLCSGACVLALLGACGPSAPPPDDEEITDGGVEDGVEGERPAAGFGVLTGDCDVIDDELESPEPSLFVNHLDFGADGYDDADLARLSAGGQEMIGDGNAGGSSVLSEVFAFEALARCEGASLVKTETEVTYTTNSKLTDILVQIDDDKVGVSVVRAVGFPFDAPYTVEQATDVMTGKLADILLSSASVAPEDAWVKQILHVIAYGDEHAVAVEQALATIDAAVKADTIVIVTVTDGDDAALY